MHSIGKTIEDKPMTQTKPLPWLVKGPVMYQKPFIVDLLNYSTINKETVHNIMKSHGVFKADFFEDYGKYEKQKLGIEQEVNYVIQNYYKSSKKLLEYVEISLDYCRIIWDTKPHYSDCFIYPWCSLLFSIKRMILRNYYSLDNINHLIELVPRFKQIVEELPEKFLLIAELVNDVKNTIKNAREIDDTTTTLWEDE
jgi:hypothetical protein